MNIQILLLSLTLLGKMGQCGRHTSLGGQGQGQKNQEN